MPKASRKAAKLANKASHAGSKRWIEEKSRFCTQSQGTQTDREIEKLCLPSETEEELSSVQDIVDFANKIPDLMASLPVPISVDDDSCDVSEVLTRKITNILERYGHDLERATTEKLEVFQSNLCITTCEFLEAAFESELCDKCSSSAVRVLRKTEVKAGIYSFELLCKNCQAKSNRLSDTRRIKSKFRPKSWFPNYLLLSFLSNFL